jgi:hypothetical protein
MSNESKSISLGNIAEGVAIAVAVGFVVSVIYDWGFVYALDLDFASFPTTTADHFRSGVLWFPKLLAFVLAFFAMEFQFQRVERGLSEKEIIESSRNPEVMKKFREGPWKLVQWIAPLAVINYILNGGAYASLLPIMLSITWMGFAEWCSSAPLIQLRRSRGSQLAFMFLPIIAILAFFSGYNTAVDAASRKPTDVAIDNGQLTGPMKGKILRTFERGLLVLRDDNRIVLIPWDQVRSVLNQKPYTPFRGVLCEWFGHCTEEKSTTGKPVQPTTKAGEKK